MNRELTIEVSLHARNLFERGLVEYSRGSADDIAVLERIVLNLSSDETRNVSHVHHEVRTVDVGDLAETLVVPITRVRRSTTDEDPGLEEEGVLLESVVVDQTGGRVDLVRKRLEVDRRGRDLLLGSVGTMGKVTSVSEAETHDTVLRLNESSESSKVGSRSRAVQIQISSVAVVRCCEAVQMQKKRTKVER